MFSSLIRMRFLVAGIVMMRIDSTTSELVALWTYRERKSEQALLGESDSDEAPREGVGAGASFVLKL